jgi:hypothetical protein
MFKEKSYQLPIDPYSHPWRESDRWCKRAGLHVVHYDLSLHSSKRHLGAELEQANWLAHGGLDMEGLDVLPVLLEEGDKEVDAYISPHVNMHTRERGERRTKHNVCEDLVIIHLNMANRDTKTKDLFELELYGRAYFDDLV